MFGGAMLAATDPIPAVQLSRIFRKTQVWTKGHELIFRKPARTNLYATITLEEDQIKQIKLDLRKDGKHIKVYTYALFDPSGELVAEVRSTVYMRNPRHSVFLSQETK